MTTTSIDRIRELLGDEAESLLTHTCTGIPKESIHLTGPDHVDRVLRAVGPQSRGSWSTSSGSTTTDAWAAPATSRSCRSTRASSTRRPPLSRPTPSTSTRRTSSELAIEGGCNAVASTLGVLGLDVAQVRPPHPVHGQDQPQRAADLPEQLPADPVRAASSRPSTWGPPRSARRSTSAATTSGARSSRSPRPSPTPTSWAWRRSSGATCATRSSRRTAPTTTPPPT